MPRIRSERAIDNEQQRAEAEAVREQQRLDRIAQNERDRVSRETFLDREAKERAAERERQRLAEVRPLDDLPPDERDAALKKYAAVRAAQKWDHDRAQLIVLPNLRVSGAGDVTVAFQRFDSDAGKVVADSDPLVEAGRLLNPATSPQALIERDRAAWDKQRAARKRGEQAAQHAHREFVRQVEYDRKNAATWRELGERLMNVRGLALAAVAPGVDAMKPSELLAFYARTLRDEAYRFHALDEGARAREQMPDDARQALGIPDFEPKPFLEEKLS